MGDILKEMLQRLPPGKISDATFEAANIVFYTKDREYLSIGREDIKKVVNEFKKRVELRADPSILIPEENAKRIINEMIPEEASAQEMIFDKPRSVVIIHSDKPGVVIGKQGELLRRIRKEILWTPIIKRIPPLRSKLIESIRGVLYENSEYRKKFMNKVGHRIYDGWLREKRHEWIRITHLGGARQVGRSCLFLQTPESRILMDCGINVAATDQDAYPYLDSPEFDISELDAVIVSHAHLDHSGLVPYLFKMGYKGPVYCTTPTRDVMSLLQLDLTKVAIQEGKEPLYTSNEIKDMVLHTIPLNYDSVTDITPDVRLTFYNAGHILGSAMVHLNIGNGLHNLLYTGDLKYGKTHLLEAAITKFPRLETVIMESTYGGKGNVLPPHSESDDYVKDVIEETLNRKGKILMPVLGSGRAQEVMVIIAKLIRNGKLKPIPVYIDGMLWDITAIHTAYPEYLSREVRNDIFQKDNNPFLMDVFKRVGSNKERKEIIDGGEPCIILATSGMLEGGPSVEYLKGLCENKNNTIIFSSYQPEGSLGKRVRDGETEIILKDSESNKPKLYNIKMEVYKVEVTGHSDRRQLINFIKRCQPQPRKVIIVHGENSRALDLSSTLHKQFRIETIVPKNLESVRIR